MGKRCCIYGCTSYCLSAKTKCSSLKLSVFRFPKNVEEKQMCIKVIPNANLK